MNNRKLIVSYVLVFLAAWVLHDKLAYYCSGRAYARLYNCVTFNEKPYESCMEDYSHPQGLENLVLF